MSADNGTYVLQTAGPEFRVAHLQNIEMIYGEWDEGKGKWTPNKEFIRISFTHSPVYDNLETAWDAATSMDNSYLISAYGTNLIAEFAEFQFSDLIEEEDGKDETQDETSSN